MLLGAAPFVRSPNSSLNSTTTYTVTCSLNGCTNTDSVIITVNPLPNVDAGFDQTICLGSFANLSGANLERANLSGANLSKVNIGGALFCNTKTDKGIDNSGC